MNQYTHQKLDYLHKRLELVYLKYKEYQISEKQYLALIKPIDQAIDNIEMSTLQDNPVLKESS